MFVHINKRLTISLSEIVVILEKKKHRKKTTTVITRTGQQLNVPKAASAIIKRIEQKNGFLKNITRSGFYARKIRCQDNSSFRGRRSS